MSTLFVGGLMVVGLGFLARIGLDFLARKGRDPENKIEQEERIRKIEQEIQQIKDKVLQQFPW